jgi:hypothetical protein
MRSRRFPLFFLLLNGPQNISRPGNVRQINLWLLLDCRPVRRTGRRFSATAKGGAHTPGLVFLNRTGMRFLLRNSHFWEDVENHSALDFQLSC